MAYLDLQQRFDTAAATAMPLAHFEEVEWRVIMLAGKERLASIAEPGLGARLLAWLGGRSPSHRLANPRLEALRRFSVLAWNYSYALPISAVAGLLNAGFSEAQLEYALGSIARVRNRVRRRRSV